ncbi:MAG: hypothetical protein EHM12_10880 [Dehalococcoidia bacterium]|nr:MAG: hypothetical protein EHM12_10880 [Dehalococcoidia bacterium]
MSSFKQLDTQAIIIMVLFAGVMIYYLIAVFTTPFFSPWALLPPILGWMYIITSEFEWAYFVHLPKFFWTRGSYGTLISPINFHSGARFSVLVAVKYRVVKNLENIKFARRGLSSLSAMINGNVIIEFTGDTERLDNYSGKDADLPEGSYLYDGSISNPYTSTRQTQQKIQMRWLTHQLTIKDGVLEKLSALNLSLSQSDDKSVINVAKKLDLIMKDSLEARKPILMSPQGGSGRQRQQEGEF